MAGSAYTFTTATCAATGAFHVVEISGQPSVIVDQTYDTLTMTSVGPIELTTNATTDTISFSGAPHIAKIHTGSSGYLPYYTGDNEVSKSETLFWDSTNSKLGVGTTAPSAHVTVSGHISARGDVICQTLYAANETIRFLNGARFQSTSAGNIVIMPVPDNGNQGMAVVITSGGKIVSKPVSAINDYISPVDPSIHVGDMSYTGFVSSSNVVFSSGGHSGQWEQAYTDSQLNKDDITWVASSSAGWNETRTTVKNNSAAWSGAAAEAFKTISTSGQTDIVADAAADTLTLSAMGSFEIHHHDDTDTIILSGGAGGGGGGGGSTEDVFKTISTSGWPDVVADSSTDTLTLSTMGKLEIHQNADNDTIILSGGSGELNEPSFKTISTADWPDVVADSTTDTLTLSAMGKLEIHQNADNDTIILSGGSGELNQNAFGKFSTAGWNDIDADAVVDTVTLSAMGHVEIHQHTDTIIISAGADSGGGGGSSEWTDTGSILHPSEETADSVVIGGTDLAGSDIILNKDGSAIFNEQGANVDFRIESDTSTHAFYVSGIEAGKVGINTSQPDEALTVTGNVSCNNTGFFLDVILGGSSLHFKDSDHNADMKTGPSISVNEQGSIVFRAKSTDNQNPTLVVITSGGTVAAVASGSENSVTDSDDGSKLNTASWNSTNTDVNANSGNWGTAYGWGDHSGAGYLTSYGSVTNHSDVSDAGSGSIITGDERTNLTSTHSTVKVTSGNWDTAYTHSQGNVTDHSDVSDAGSGQIITGDERTQYTSTYSTVKANSSSWTGGGGGEVNTASNVGTGDGWFAQKSSADLEFKSLSGFGPLIEITADSTMIKLSASTQFTGDERTDLASTHSTVSVTSGNWNTAYGWGDHSGAGYLTSYGSVTNHNDVSDAGSGQIITADERTNLTSTHTTVKNTSGSWGHGTGNVTDHSDVSDAGSGQIITADERTNLTSTHSTVKSTSSNWDTAYTHSQGNVTDHSDVSNAGSGQIITSDERVQFTSTYNNVKSNSGNWNTAYGWGDHGAAGYLTSYGSVTSHSDVSNAGSGQIITADERTNLTSTHSTVKATSSNWDTAYTHSQGNVTDHGDVSDAGSGQIITDSERNKLTNNYTTVNSNSADWTWVAANSGEDISFTTSEIYGASTDQYYSKTRVLLNFEGSNNDTFTFDESFGSPTLTFIADAKISTSEKKFGSSSLYLDGTGDYIKDDNLVSNLLDGVTYTGECWVYITDSNATRVGTLFSFHDTGGNNRILIRYQTHSSNATWRINHYDGDSPGDSYGSTYFNKNQWYHVACVSDGTNTKYYIDGTLDLTVARSIDVANASNNKFSIGQEWDGGSTSDHFIGYIDSFRFTDGVARYTSNFTAPTEAFPGADASTTVITSMSGYVTPVAMRVKEADGTPNVSNVHTLVVSNGTLTDDGNGQVTITTGGGGGGSGDITSVVAGTLLDGGADSGDATLNVDLTEATEAAIANGDYILFLDGGASGTHAKENIADVASLFAGTGMTATNSVINLDAAQTGITSLLATDIKIGEDDQTKIDFETADEIHFYTNNSNNIVIDTAGRLGINNTSPSSLYSEANNLVVGGGSGAEGITIYTGTGDYGALYFADGTSGSDRYRGGIEYNQGNNFLRLVTDGSSRLHISSGGNVGIGTADAEYGLYSGANNLVVGSGSGDEGITIYTGTGNVGALYFADGTSGSARYRGGLEYSHADDQLKIQLGDYYLKLPTADGNANQTLKTDSNGNLSWSDFVVSYGSVTNHTDVSDAGSGQIITSAERNKVTNSYTSVNSNSGAWSYASTNSATATVKNHSDLTSNGVVTYDIDADKLQTIVLKANQTGTYLGAESIAAGKTILVRLSANGADRTLSWHETMVFVGEKPTSIASGKQALLSITTFGTLCASAGKSDVTCSYAVQD